MAYTPSVKIKALTANGTVVIPAGHSIDQVVVESTNANAITGGLNIGTTNGGVDVLLALAVAGNSVTSLWDATILKRLFSMTVDQTLYIQAATLWNGASVNVYFITNRII